MKYEYIITNGGGGGGGYVYWSIGQLALITCVVFALLTPTQIWQHIAAVFIY